MTIWTDRLDELATGKAKLPQAAERLNMGALTSWEPGHVVKDWPLDQTLLNPGNVLFGGYLACLADQMVNFTAMTVLTDNQIARTSDLQISYFRPVTEGPIKIEGRILNRSRALVHIVVTVMLPGGQLAARATGVVAVIAGQRAAQADGAQAKPANAPAKLAKPAKKT